MRTCFDTAGNVIEKVAASSVMDAGPATSRARMRRRVRINRLAITAFAAPCRPWDRAANRSRAKSTRSARHQSAASLELRAAPAWICGRMGIPVKPGDFGCSLGSMRRSRRFLSWLVVS
jgi:hypothetical protein